MSIFNVSDAQSYNNAGVWNRNAYYWEGRGFDSCLGHPQQQGEYHHHVSPKCLYDQTDSLHHS
ncbi:YHYH protein, partial [Klebsiella pneumoniae]|uniref:YHYH protein n=1 Tax=Klebsiella pneumoniae TaxID=573 RepID=UPI003853B297